MGRHGNGFIGNLGRTIATIATFTTFTTFFSSPIQAAETVVVQVASIRRTISLAELQTYAETGNASPNLREIGRYLSAAQQQQILQSLKTPIPIGVRELRSLLDTQLGEGIASSFASATGRKDAVGALDVEVGLVLGANNPQGLTIPSFIAAYPRQTLEIDLNQAYRVVSGLNAPFWRTQRFMAAITPRLAATPPATAFPFDPTQPGNAQVQVLSLKLDDRDSPSETLRDRNRTIPVDVYWSDAASFNKPVVVFSHGLGSVKIDMQYLARHLASHGYIVAALEHPGSNETHVRNVLKGKAPLLDPEEFLDRPKDISFVLTELAKLNQRNADLKGKVNSDRALVIGYSLGGATALSIAGGELQLENLKKFCQENKDFVAGNLGIGAQCLAQKLPENRYNLRDERVKAVISLNPTTSLLFGETGLSKISVPTLVVSSSADKTTPALTEQIATFPKIPNPKWLVGFVGATHLSIKDPQTTMDQAGQPSTIYTGGEIVGERSVEVRNYVKAIALSMAAQLTDDAQKYSIFLTPDYAQFSSTQNIPIRLIREIPPDVLPLINQALQP